MISERVYGKETKDPDFTKRFWIAEYYPYYPSGFLSDVERTCDSAEEVLSMEFNDTAIYELFDSEKRVASWGIDEIKIYCEKLSAKEPSTK